ncbi:hypothetical protein JAAARDRAFT_39160 [Jaapia argillacea MUCL 33604]|uniref:RING-type domain-containing protein n=1 Tax=Jaapia argillacea MUCL 33604 TaxID=933084 RepID=A0A067PI31_9AGAM|nr:hypothetical protein JAAARDRAFT_39160 [Jaapia argillacea MUCL 33604]
MAAVNDFDSGTRSLRRARSTGDLQIHDGERSLARASSSQVHGPGRIRISTDGVVFLDNPGQPSVQTDLNLEEDAAQIRELNELLNLRRNRRRGSHRLGQSEGGRPFDYPGSTTGPESWDPRHDVLPGNRDAGSSVPIAGPSRALVSPHRERTWSPPPLVAERPEHEAFVDLPPPRNPPPTTPTSRYQKLMASFGRGRHAPRGRKALVALIWNLSFGITQIIAIVAILAYGSGRRSPTTPGKNEWQACARPLGVWDILWVLKVGLGCCLAFWGWSRDRAIRLTTEADGQGSSTDAESGTRSGNARTAARRQRNTTVNGTSVSAIDTPAITAANRPHSRLYSRLSLLSSMMTLTWFLTAHILEYTSVNTCRHSSPHLWWLTFGILCIMYFAVLEVVILGLVVFIIGPIIFLLWNILLVIMGRHPLQNPHYIKPEIGKLPKSVVERIPLVLYIPPPPDEPVQSPITFPPATYTYPPKPQQKSATPTKKRFRWLRKPRKADANGGSGGGIDGKEKGEKGEPVTWEDNWEQGEYPFVRLEGNRAVCAICLMDFEEPKRIKEAKKAEEANETEGGKDKTDDSKGASEEEHRVNEISVVENVTEEQRDEILKLADAGEGAQPLRLLACGHVFHKTCLDPWLTDVSGRCPVCQRAVELPENEDKKESRRRRRRGDSP